MDERMFTSTPGYGWVEGCILDGWILDGLNRPTRASLVIDRWMARFWTREWMKECDLRVRVRVRLPQGTGGWRGAFLTGGS